MTTDKRGVSALLLQRQLGVSYKTAWLLPHKLRRAMVAPMRELFADRLIVADNADSLMGILGAFLARILRPPTL
jgi:hypothetical protein